MVKSHEEAAFSSLLSETCNQIWDLTMLPLLFMPTKPFLWIQSWEFSCSDIFFHIYVYHHIHIGTFHFQTKLENKNLLSIFSLRSLSMPFFFFMESQTIFETSIARPSPDKVGLVRVGSDENTIKNTGCWHKEQSYLMRWTAGLWGLWLALFGVWSDFMGLPVAIFNLVLWI